MIRPLLGLLLAAATGFVLVALFWPVRGLFWNWIRAFRAGDRVLIEDALKHLYDFESRRQPCTLQSLSGALGLSGDRAVRLLQRLEQLELVGSAGAEYRLSAEGRSYALRVIRIHRLWEHYFSEETGVHASEWHREAERREHTTTPQQAARLAARMGHPRYDPHGDPIPTESGEIAPPRGRPLGELPVGKVGEIVHVEDEPQAVYDQLLAAGLHPGMRVRVLESTLQRIRLEAETDEHLLAPVVAANLTVVELADDQALEGPFERLSALQPGEEARVTGISAVCRGRERRRLFDLGIVPGTIVKAELHSPGGDPTAYRIRGALIALRRDQAELIRVDRLERGAA